MTNLRQEIQSAIYSFNFDEYRISEIDGKVKYTLSCPVNHYSIMLRNYPPEQHEVEITSSEGGWSLHSEDILKTITLQKRNVVFFRNQIIISLCFSNPKNKFSWINIVYKDID